MLHHAIQRNVEKKKKPRKAVLRSLIWKPGTYPQFPHTFNDSSNTRLSQNVSPVLEEVLLYWDVGSRNAAEANNSIVFQCPSCP